MANYLYNGVEAPDINAVWVDKATYPHAYMATNHADYYFLFLSTVSVNVITSGGGFYAYGKANGSCICYSSNVGKEWERKEDEDATIVEGEESMHVSMMLVWSNTDVYHRKLDGSGDDGALYIAASDPVPVDSGGDGGGDTEEPEPKKFDLRSMLTGMIISPKRMIIGRGGGAGDGSDLSEIWVRSGPNAFDEVPAPGYYGIGIVHVETDKNLRPEIIKDGETLFGVRGTYAPPEPEPILPSEIKLTTKKVTIKENGTHEITPSSGSVGMTKVTAVVDVPTTIIEEKIDANFQEKTVIPTAGGLDVTPDRDKGYNALSRVMVAGDSALDPSNIRKGATIFGIPGEYEKTEVLEAVMQYKTVTPTADGLIVRPDSGIDGLLYVVVEGDSELISSNIREGATIFGIPGSYSNGQKYQTKDNIVPTARGVTVTADSGYNALAQVKVVPEPNLVPEKIPKGETIFGIPGTYVSPMDTVTVIPGTDRQTILPAGGKAGFSMVIVEPVDLDDNTIYNKGYEDGYGAGYAAGVAAAESSYTNLDEVRF